MGSEKENYKILKSMHNYVISIPRILVQVDLINLWTVLILIDAWNRPSTHNLGKYRQNS